MSCMMSAEVIVRVCIYMIFFSVCSSDGKDNDGDQFQCTSGRCIQSTLVCDAYKSLNCDDSTDEANGAPSNCAGKNTRFVAQLPE